MKDVVAERSIDVNLIGPLPGDIQLIGADVYYRKVTRSTSRSWNITKYLKA